MEDSIRQQIDELFGSYRAISKIPKSARLFVEKPLKEHILYLRNLLVKESRQIVKNNHANSWKTFGRRGERKAVKILGDNAKLYPKQPFDIYWKWWRVEVKSTNENRGKWLRFSFSPDQLDLDKSDLVMCMVYKGNKYDRSYLFDTDYVKDRCPAQSFYLKKGDDRYLYHREHGNL